MDVTEALALSDAYIQRCELASEESTIRNLNYLMVIDYAEKVHKIRFGQNPSKLVLSVSKYIQQHLSDPIKVQDLADALYMGRSRLSTNFKKETGINLSDYITMKKSMKPRDCSITLINQLLASPGIWASQIRAISRKSSANMQITLL